MPIRKSLIGAIFCLLSGITFSYNSSHSWNAGSPLLPRAFPYLEVAFISPAEVAICYDDEPAQESIWMVTWGQSLFSYDCDSGNITDYGDALTDPINPGSSQYYSQLGNTLYLVEGYNDPLQWIHLFDVKSHTMMYYITVVPNTVTASQCMTSFSAHHDYLIVSGGHNKDTEYKNYVEMYDITDDIWLSDVPNMVVPRIRHSCVVVDQRVYAIGGLVDNVDVEKSVELLDLSDIANITSVAWNLMIDTFPFLKYSATAVVHRSDILVFGGSQYKSTADRLTVYVIDTIARTILPAGTLNYSLKGMSGIYAWPRIFTFGGYGLNSASSGSSWAYVSTQWQYVDVSETYAINNYDKPVNVYPSTSGNTYSFIHIDSTQEAASDSVISYYVKFNIRNEVCYAPQLSVRSISGKNASSLNVYWMNNGTDRLIQNLSSISGEEPSSFVYWINNGTQIVFRIDRASSINASDACNYTLQAIVRLRCTYDTFASYSPWNAGSPLLPRAFPKHSVQSQAAICYDDEPTQESIWMVTWGQTLFSYDFNSGNITDYGDALTHPINPGASQYYSQLGNTLYLVEGYNDPLQWIHAFDVKSHTMMYYITVVPNTVTSDQCMTSFSARHDYLIVSGGYNFGYLNYVDIYDITDDIWLSDVPNMVGLRARHACVVVDQRVYAIGSNNSANWNTVELLDLSDIANITSAAWNLMIGTFPFEKTAASAVVYSSDILVLGGSQYQSAAAQLIVFVIDTIARTILPAGTLNYSLYSMSSIYALSRIFTFGGYDSPVSASTQWQYFDVSETYFTDWDGVENVLYAINNYDKPVNVYPSTSGYTYFFIHIDSTQESAFDSVISYYVKFNILNNACYDPHLLTRLGDNIPWSSLTVFELRDNGTDQYMGELVTWGYQSFGLQVQSIAAGTLQVFRLDMTSYTSTVYGYTLRAIFRLACASAPAFDGYSPWIVGNSSLPAPITDYPARYPAVCYDDEPESEAILLLDQRASLLSFDPSTSIFTDLGTIANNYSEFGDFSVGQYWTQLSNKMYMFVDSGYIRIFDIKSQTLTPINISKPYHWPSYAACIASFSTDHDYLIITGGGYARVYAPYIYDITDGVWLSNVQGMQIPRSVHACVVVDQKVYAIAGSSTKTTEILDVSDMANIESASWRIMHDQFKYQFDQGLSAAVYSTDILVIGGLRTTIYDLVIQVIDTVTESITAGGPLQFASGRMSSIYVYPNIYSFGGRAHRSRTLPSKYDVQSSWQYYSLSESSAINNYDKPVNIYPSTTESTTATINIRSTLNSTNVSYYAKFVILNEDCHDATVTIDGLTGRTPDSLLAYFGDSFLANCKSSVGSCDTPNTCVQDQGVPSFHASGTEIVIRIDREVTDTASYWNRTCDYTLTADVTLTCKMVPTVFNSNCVKTNGSDLIITAGVASQAIFSPDEMMQFYVQNDGNVCLYTITDNVYKTERFCTYSEGTNGSQYTLVISTEGNMTVKDGNDDVKWSSNTEAVGPFSLCVEDCGLAMLKGADRHIVWQSDYTVNTTIGDYPSCATILDSNCIEIIDEDYVIPTQDSTAIYSPNGGVQFWVQDDGNVCLYTMSGNTPIERYCTDTVAVDASAYYLVIETDGNMAVIDTDGMDTELWSSDSHTRNGPLTFCVKDCGLATLRDVDGVALWQSLYTENVDFDDYPFCADEIIPPTSTSWQLVDEEYILTIQSTMEEDREDGGFSASIFGLLYAEIAAALLALFVV